MEGKFIQQINKGNAERVAEIKWMSDNKTLLFNQTSADGYYNLFTIRAMIATPHQNSLPMTKEITGALY